MIGALYLNLYNTFQLSGWAYLCFLTWSHLGEKQSMDGLWERTELPLKIFQTAMVIEVVHCLVGLVRSSPVTTAMQIVSRVFIVWLILEQVPDTRTAPGLLLCLTAWPFAEMVRYLYYLANALGWVPYLLTWARYSFFLVLYPLGVAGETLSCYAALPYCKEKRPLDVSMPNAFNFTFSTYYVLIGIMLLYIPGLPVMYQYMLSQRRKVLGGAKTKSQ
ncbi:Very-long-chain (3R)-3-hydroxyacyl-CoA dehydratase 2 [Amphibalanus amphitrite]|uniref:Very-long-chain (3R)-3-hydroxyacyl-CoA dehydratase n=1 Tax=Amphibalanus amphitrite TaxID=1232801 RepID=A0A6A4X2A7_AMPAM|nr:Very-long-chain (3R)-3-hydroxyacyl-CoA dehydratase 2 [Amphibalanus amphitrite]